MVIKYVVAQLPLQPGELGLDCSYLFDGLLVDAALGLPEPVDLEEAQQHGYQVREQTIGGDEVFVDRDVPLILLLVVLDVLLEEALKQALLAHAELLLLDLQFLVLVPQLADLLLIDRVLLVHVQERIYLSLLVLDLHEQLLEVMPGEHLFLRYRIATSLVTKEASLSSLSSLKMSRESVFWLR